MSASEAAHRPKHRGLSTKLWLALFAIILAGVALAWVGAETVRAQTVQVETIEEGSGPTIEPVDGVIFEYEGRLRDGSVFDSSEGRGPAAAIASQTVPGFAEALTKMRKGGRYRIHIPARLGYGENPPPGSVPPNSDLEFDVHVMDVVPNAAMMMQGGVPPQGQPELPPQGQPQAQPEAPSEEGPEQP